MCYWTRQLLTTPRGMQDCFRLHPEMYGSELEDDEDEVEEELRAEAAARSTEGSKEVSEPELASSQAPNPDPQHSESKTQQPQSTESSRSPPVSSDTAHDPVPNAKLDANMK